MLLFFWFLVFFRIALVASWVGIRDFSRGCSMGRARFGFKGVKNHCV